MEATILIPTLIIAVTQMVKMALPQVIGWVTILIALVVGVLIALIDTHIGVDNISVGQGLVLALSAVGITAAFGKAGGGTAGDSGRIVA